MFWTLPITALVPLSSEVAPPLLSGSGLELFVGVLNSCPTARRSAVSRLPYKVRWILVYLALCQGLTVPISWVFITERVEPKYLWLYGRKALCLLLQHQCWYVMKSRIANGSTWRHYSEASPTPILVVRVRSFAFCCSHGSFSQSAIAQTIYKLY